MPAVHCLLLVSFVVALVVLGCHSQSATEDSPHVAEPKALPSPTDDGQVAESKALAGPDDEVAESAPSAPRRFEAVLRIDAKAGAKEFRGVWLERPEGERLLIAYRSWPWWRDFEGKRVSVEGERYEPGPMEQAIQAPHFRVHHLELVARRQAVSGIVGVSAERTMTGRFEARAGAKGTKLEGESRRVFVGEDGTAYNLSGSPNPAPPMDRDVTVVARPVEPSAYVARLGGPYLWIISVKPGQ